MPALGGQRRSGPSPTAGSEGAPALGSCRKTQRRVGVAGLEADGLHAAAAPGDSWDASGKPKRAAAALTAAGSPALVPEGCQPGCPGTRTESHR